MKKGRVLRVWGLISHSSDNNTRILNRDKNASDNILQIAKSIRDFDEIPFEFRKEVNLRQIDAYHSREYEFEGIKLNKAGQIIKFKTTKVEHSGGV